MSTDSDVWLRARLSPVEVSTMLVLELGTDDRGRAAFLQDLVHPEVVINGDSVGEPGLVERLDAGLDGRPLDLVLDAASHRYAETRASFEVAFPRLRPDGRYLLEDWNWAHSDDQRWQAGDHTWSELPALTNLIVELVVVAGTDPGIVSALHFGPDTVEVVRGDRPLPSPFRLAHHYRNRGLRFRPML